MGIIKKIQESTRIDGQAAENYLWKIFHRYLDAMDINFNYPDDWNEDDDGVRFTGEDRYRGDIQPMSITIPFDFFTNTDQAFKNLEDSILRDVVKKKFKEYLASVNETERLRLEWIRIKKEAESFSK